MKANSIIGGTLVLLGLNYGAYCKTKIHQRPNVLFIAVDDLRPELNCYGKTTIKSPNIDKLAAEGVLFQRAFCNVPVCGASRASIMTGLYPTPTRFTDFGARSDKEVPEYEVLPETFKKNGYFTTTLGKIFHHPDDGLKSWSELPYRPDYPNSLDQQELWRDYQSNELSWTKQKDLPLGAAGPAWEAGDVADTDYYDGKTTELAIKKLTDLSQKGQPFFFALGFIRPHLPFVCPKKYWDLYGEKEMGLASNPYMPKGAPADANFNSSELRSYTNIAHDNSLIPDEQAYILRQGYAACVSYVDAQLGLIINQLKKLGLYENTIIVLWGDHGWSLGEHTHWGKHTCFNNALRVPLIVKIPNGLKWAQSKSLVSLIDLYPTLCDLAKIKMPDHLEGKSFVPVLKDVNTSVNEYVFCRWTNGETVKSDKFMYTQYYTEKNNNDKPKSSMLYNHDADPEENSNVVNVPENAEVVAKLKRVLQEHLNSRIK